MSLRCRLSQRDACRIGTKPGVGGAVGSRLPQARLIAGTRRLRGGRFARSRARGPGRAESGRLVTMPPDTTIALATRIRQSSCPLTGGIWPWSAGLARRFGCICVRSTPSRSVPLAGTEDAVNPFFSPDGRWLGFFADGKLKKVSVDGGAPVALADARTPRGEAWLADDSILITPNNNVGLSRVPSVGGAPQPFSHARRR